MNLIDTHSHLYLDRFDHDRSEVVQRAFAAGVNKIFLPNIDLATIPSMNQLTNAFPGKVYAMMGLHPCDAKDDYIEVLNEMENHLANEHHFIAIGETGIDLYWDKSTLEVQKLALRRQIQWAKDYQLPIVIHARDSFDELFEVFDEENDSNLTGVFHCFTGTVEQAIHIIDYGGFKLGVGGVVTFKNSPLREVLTQIPLEHIVLETDSPFLSPHPHRGKRNESSYVSLVADTLAGVYEMLPEKIGEITSVNALDLFPKAKIN